MTASPAQVANDMAAQAKYWSGRDMNIELACEAAHRVIRAFVEGKQPHGNAIRAALDRLQRHLSYSQLADQPVWKSMARAEATIRHFRDAPKAMP